MKEHPTPDVKKVSDFVYKIEKTGTMNVPVKIFADEQILEKMKADDCLVQASNVASLPGIVGESIVLMDAHVGYGMSIGGVAAFDLQEGIISPSAIGFDINCLPPDARIQTAHGTWKYIGEAEETWSAEQLQFFDELSQNTQETNLHCFMKRFTEEPLYQITTASGQELKVTAEHPILTQTGMKPAKEIGPDDELVVHNFKGVRHEEPTDEVILTEEMFEETLDQLDVTDTGRKRTQILEHIRSLNILPLRYNSKETPLLAKLIGFITGDGNITFTERTRSVSCYGKPEDLKQIRDDIRKIGFKTTNIYTRTRKSTINTHYGKVETTGTEGCIRLSTSSLAVLLIALGCPHGAKVHSKFRVPAWIMDAPLWQKRLFIAAFFGAELSTPSTLNKYNFYAPSLNMSKSETLRKNGEAFLQDLRDILTEFDITTSEIVDVPGRAYNGKRGRSIGLRFTIHANPENLVKFYGRVSFEYNKERSCRASLAVAYIYKKAAVLEGRHFVRSTAQHMYEHGVAPQQLVSMFESSFTSESFIRHSFWENRGKKCVPPNFISFEEYIKKYAVGGDGFVRAKVIDVSLQSHAGWVYDVTMNNENHNFIAENVVVSNCGVRLLATNLTKDTVQPKLPELLEKLYETCPVGVGVDGVRLDDEQFKQVMLQGAGWAVANGYGVAEDLERCEATGCLPEADPMHVPDRARHRGKRQLGTVGAGNHFVEVQVVDKTFGVAADVFGLEEGNVVIMIHCGSRGFGHQICSDYIRKMEDEQPTLAKNIVDRNLMYTPLGTDLAKQYWGAMNAAANFAFCNRHILGHNVRKAFEQLFPGAEVTTVYDVCHNIAKRETHTVDGEQKELMVHRKGATRAFPAGSEDIPAAYREVGQPVLIPGSMGTSSWVLVGDKGSLEQSFGSTAHGAGRMMSRMRAKKDFPAEDVQEDLKRKGIQIKAATRKGISEEAPGAYKDVDAVIAVSDSAGIAKKVARLVPIGVIKG